MWEEYEDYFRENRKLTEFLKELKENPEKVHLFLRDILDDINEKEDITANAIRNRYLKLERIAETSSDVDDIVLSAFKKSIELHGDEGDPFFYILCADYDRTNSSLGEFINKENAKDILAIIKDNPIGFGKAQNETSVLDALTTVVKKQPKLAREGFDLIISRVSNDQLEKAEKYYDLKCLLRTILENNPELAIEAIKSGVSEKFCKSSCLNPLEVARAKLEYKHNKTIAMTSDIKEGMAKTKESGYGHVSEADRRSEQQTTLSVQNMKKAKEDLVK